MTDRSRGWLRATVVALLVLAAVTAPTASFAATPSTVASAAPTSDPAGLTVVGWGTGDAGVTSVPNTLLGVTKVEFGGYTAMALRSDGKVIGWGEQPRVPGALPKVVDIATSALARVAVTDTGTVRAWNQNGALPVPADLAGVASVSAGLYENLALRSDGTLVGWDPQTGALHRLPVTSGVAAVDAGPTDSLALLTDGTVVGWQTYTGSGGGGASLVPAGLAEVTAVAAGRTFGAALKSDGSIVTWGNPQVPLPTSIAATPDNPIVQISAGGNHLVWRHTDGTLDGAGNNGNGQLTPPAAVRTAADVVADGNTTLAVVPAILLSVQRTVASVPEISGRAVHFTIARSGASDAFALRYTNAPVRTDTTAGAGSADVSGMGAFTRLDFAADQASADVAFTVNGDSTSEYAEGFMPYLELGGIERITTPQPGGGAMPSTAIGTYIQASDQQPDALVSNASSSGYVGARVYNTTGTKQTVTRDARRGATPSSFFRVCNTKYAVNRLELHASRLTGGVTGRFFRGTRDITKALRSTAGYPMSLQRSGCVKLRVRFHVASTATIGATRTARLSATWSGDVVTRDVVRARVHVVR